MKHQFFLLPKKVHSQGITGTINLPTTEEEQENFLSLLADATNTLYKSVVQRVVREEVSKIQNGNVYEKPRV